MARDILLSHYRALESLGTGLHLDRGEVGKLVDARPQVPDLLALSKAPRKEKKENHHGETSRNAKRWRQSFCSRKTELLVRFYHFTFSSSTYNIHIINISAALFINISHVCLYLCIHLWRNLPAMKNGTHKPIGKISNWLSSIPIQPQKLTTWNIFYKNIKHFARCTSY